MILKYERACVEAGLSRKQTAAIRKVFEYDRKKLKRQKEQIKEKGITFLPVDDLMHKSEDTPGYRILNDFGQTPEEEALHNLYLERLRETLKDLSPEDLRLLFAYFEESKNPTICAARKLGISTPTVQYRVDKLVCELREKII